MSRTPVLLSAFAAARAFFVRQRIVHRCVVLQSIVRPYIERRRHLQRTGNRNPLLARHGGPPWITLLGAAAALLVACTDGGTPATEFSVPGDERAFVFGNPASVESIPREALPEDVSQPDIVIGSGSPETCTGARVVDAVREGGVITFDCGPDPVVIEMEETAKVFNAEGRIVVIDGGNKVTLRAKGARRLLYMNTCDEALTWSTSHCDNQDHPSLALQNLRMEGGNARGIAPDGSGGAVYVAGGRFKVFHVGFFGNRSEATGPDTGGGAVRVRGQYNNEPVLITQSSFGSSATDANHGANGGGLSGLGTSFTIFNSTFRFNRAEGNGANPARDNTPGGGSGGAIYMDGNDIDLRLVGSIIEDNHANEGGGAIFFVSNDRSGVASIFTTTLRRNPSEGFESEGMPGVFALAREVFVSRSTLE